MNVNEIAILVSTLLAIAVGSIWYSPLVFGKHWQKAAGLTDADLELTKPMFLRLLSVAFVSNVCMLFALAHAVRFADMYDVPILHLIASIVVLLGGSVVSMVVWEKRSYMYFAIHIGYIALVATLGVLVISYWPW